MLLPGKKTFSTDLYHGLLGYHVEQVVYVADFNAFWILSLFSVITVAVRSSCTDCSSRGHAYCTKEWVIFQELGQATLRLLYKLSAIHS